MSNATAAVGDRVRVRTAYYNRDRHLDGREGVVSSFSNGGLYNVHLDTGQDVQTMAVTKLPENSSRFGPSTRDRLIQIDPTALNISTLDGRRVQAVQVAKQVLGDVTVQGITELAAFLVKTDNVAPETASVGAIDTAAELERAKKFMNDSYDGPITVTLDPTDDDDVVEIEGHYLKEKAVTDLITYLQAALVVHKDLRSKATPF